MLQNSCALFFFFTPLQSLTVKKTSRRYQSEHTDKKHIGICSLLLSSLLHHFLPFASFTLSPVCLQESRWFPSYTVSSCAKWICLPLTRLFNILSPLCFVTFSLFFPNYSSLVLHVSWLFISTTLLQTPPSSSIILPAGSAPSGRAPECRPVSSAGSRPRRACIVSREKYAPLCQCLRSPLSLHVEVVWMRAR